MIREYISKESGNTRLLIFFTGWSTDTNVAKDIKIPRGYDFMLVRDYRELVWEPIDKKYEESLIIAWSLGVPAAQILYPFISKDLKLTGLFAVNGSRHPVDDVRGIPVNIFTGTLDTLNERNLHKFRIRTAGGIEKFNKVKEFLRSDLGIDSLKDELSKFLDMANPEEFSPEWDHVFISADDKIFPVENLLNEWKDSPVTVLQNSDHLPDLQTIFNLVVKDKNVIAEKFDRSIGSYNANAGVQKENASRLVEILKESGQNYTDILEIGAGAGNLTSLLFKAYPDAKISALDIGRTNHLPGVKYMREDAEIILSEFPQNSFDLVISGSTFQWFHSPFRCLQAIEKILRKGGMAAFSTYLKGNFSQLESVTGNSLLYLTPDQWELLVKRTDLEIEFTEVIETTMLFHSVNDIFHHLKSTGVNALSGEKKTLREMKMIMENYPVSNGNYPLTYLSYLMKLKKK